MRASFMSFALILIPTAAIGSGLISKRIFLSSRKNLIPPPAGGNASLSPTVSTGVPFNLANKAPSEESCERERRATGKGPGHPPKRSAGR